MSERVIRPWKLVVADCVEYMAQMEEGSVDAIVTDPPYGLKFMGKGWDGLGHGSTQQAWHRLWADQAFRVLKPGGHVVAFGGTRTYHRLASAIEDAGFEIRDQLQWLYGQGFPKSMNVGKAIGSPNEWDGWGTALKPAHEPIVLARKPLIGTVAKNVLEHGTGGLNIDATRIPTEGQPGGRWPANVILDETAGAMLDEQTGTLSGGAWPSRRGADDGNRQVFGEFKGQTGLESRKGISGGASRFFYCAKASKKERNLGLDHLPDQQFSQSHGGQAALARGESEYQTSENASMGLNRVKVVKNNHPTVKPVALMQWLVTLITPPNGLVLDPFVGSGSTGIAAVNAGFRFLGVDVDPEYVAIARARIKAHCEFVTPD